MEDILDLDRYPLDREGSPEWDRLVEQSLAALAADGMFNLEGFLRPGIAEQAVREIKPVMDARSHVHKRLHNIYFKPSIPELAPDHPALRKVETISHTVCADQIPGSTVMAIYEYEPLVRFLAATMGKARLHVMQDPLARTNVMAYRAGEALNWHFDRSEFTTTLLLQQAEHGGDLEYRTDLRSDEDPNYDGVARLLEGRDPEARVLRMKPGTLNVFRGKNTAHRVTTVEGDRERMIAVFSYYEKPGVMFSDEERVGFYGRAA
ncbi:MULTISPECIES: 2OG-Fe(II) oxygenase [unclassified Mesorhizobium]|uniref:HalD/BesD family halogenase n=1 Tax=unclassified Mesorhizobium TaxID=325217 RepID=UPI000FD827CA|nr:MULTISPECIES: 2OG-Fe(II) oxygenase [unclassified Mesorhizobium]TGR37928.1 2OG-Fe(II) oxygenase [bacterium M00.F.Ca.ET.199.01.1.1]TGU23567.1 2OG-Fe(II) oxygenase [bacterium M00.F.Ca.ET.156.01.1.1]TGV90919.1 2OG-Fe(II) oxygenase [Mesorhizobium sp. M00.F.Ca.ET.149.01.1.1]TIS87069.1 MAG: 2OG-Fe(II) oxygenase [Mesorhizobium sp.]TGP92848.1 2OG-Fe(II) oxygenase [Mesorhizobium sp. M8A.F.Ca.ET.218.01.1.1]